MFEALGRITYRWRWPIIAAALAVVAVGALWGSGVIPDLKSGGYTNPDSDSGRAQAVLDDSLGRTDADIIVIYRSPTESVDDPRFRSAVESTLADLPTDLVSSATTYWTTESPDLVSTDRHATYAVLSLSTADEDKRVELFDRVEPMLDAPGLSEQYGGIAPMTRDIEGQISDDLAMGEAISLPVVFVLLIIIFGGLAAAAMPLAVGCLAILGAFTALRGLTAVTDVSIFALNIVTLLGLGLAIDYGLFVVSRFREELRRHGDVQQAIARTSATAGRTVAVSGLIVATSLVGLSFFPQVFLRSMGFGGVAAVLIAVLAALVVLPALLSVLGHRIDALSVRPLTRRVFRRRTPRDASSADGGWARIAKSVMRRPVVYVVVIVAFLVALGLPALRMILGGVDERVLPADAASRVAADTISTDFPDQQTSPILVAVELPGPATDPAQQAALADYADRLGRLDGATSAAVTGAEGDVARVSVGFDGEPTSPAARELVERVRAAEPPAGAEALVGGQTAQLVDLLDSLGDILPWMALAVVAATFVLLFLAFGSVLLPVKAVLMNVVSLGATFGVLVLVFQEGHLSGLLGFTSTGDIEATMPVLILAVVFGLSMDYEVFLLSRIREQYDLTGDNTSAVATGLQRTGRIITSAALLLIVVVAAFSASGIVFVKMIGVGMLVAILVDATLVRVLLVPATMRLLGRANWWSPRILRRFYARYGITESDADSDEPAGRQPELVGSR